MKKLPKRTKYFFDQFVNAVNKQILTPNDWKCFYVFIQAAHEYRTNLLERELEELLIANGFQSDMAECLSYAYHHGRGLLESRVSLNYKYKP